MINNRNLRNILTLLLVLLIPSIILAQNKADSTQASLSDSSQTSISVYLDKFKTTLLETKPELTWSTTFGKLFWCIAIITFAFLFLKYLIRPLEVIAKRSSSRSKYINKLIPIIRISFWAFIIYLLVVGTISPSGEIFFIFLAIIGITIGFSMLDFLKNILGGIVILLERPFQIGDRIRLGEYYGEIKHIGLRSLKIIAGDNSLVSIPNSEVFNKSITNRNTGSTTCLVSVNFYFSPELDVAEAKKIASRAASISQYIYLNEPITVLISNEVHAGRSLIRLNLSAYVLDLRYESLFASEITEILISEFNKIGFNTPNGNIFATLSEK